MVLPDIAYWPLHHEILKCWGLGASSQSVHLFVCPPWIITTHMQFFSLVNLFFNSWKYRCIQKWQIIWGRYIICSCLHPVVLWSAWQPGRWWSQTSSATRRDRPTLSLPIDTQNNHWIKKPSQEFWSIAPVGCSSPRLPIRNQCKIWYQLKQMLKYLNLKTLRIYIRYLGEVRLLTTSCCITELERWGWWRKNEEWAVFLQFGDPALRSYDDSQELSSLQVSEDWRWDGTMKAFSLFLIARSTKWNIVQVWSQEGDWGKWLHQGHGETLLCSRVFF